MSGKKSLFLFLALLLPIIVFVFLKFFGKNEFGVKPLFQDAIDAPAACASFAYTAPYTISDSTLQRLNWNSTDSVTLIIFDDKNPENRIKKHGQIERIIREFETERLNILCLIDSGESKWLSNIQERLKVKVVELSAERLAKTKSCVFLLNESDNAVIVDSKKGIRGQYNLHDLEDADRLFVHELNIIFKRY